MRRCRPSARAYQSLQVQSQTLAYIDTFMILAVAASIMFLLSFVVKKNDPARVAGHGANKRGQCHDRKC